MGGFLLSNIKYCRQFFKFYSPVLFQYNNFVFNPQVGDMLQYNSNQIEIKSQELLSELATRKMFIIPWGHHRVILNKCENIDEARFYINQIVENNWSRSILETQIATNLYKPHEKNTNNFNLTMPKVESGLANEIIKDDHILRFLQISNENKELELENALVQHMTQFFIESGKGFAFMGSHYPIKNGSREYKIDLLFYHTKLRRYIVIVLKVMDFDPDLTKKLVFHTTAVDKLVKNANEKPTIGILLCREKDDVVVDFASKNIESDSGAGKIQFWELTEEIKEMIPTDEELQDEILRYEKIHFEN